MSPWASPGAGLGSTLSGSVVVRQRALGYASPLSMVRDLKASANISISHSNAMVATPKAKKTTKILATDGTVAPSVGTILSS